MTLTFDDDECYCLLLAMNCYLEDYVPATSGELNHMRSCEGVELRLMEWYDAKRRKHGHSELYAKRREHLKALHKLLLLVQGDDRGHSVR